MTGQDRPPTRVMLYGSHLVRCKVCREQWLREYKEIPESKRNHALEQIIQANHRESNLI